MKNHPDLPLKIVIIGGGAGGVELVLNMHSRLQRLKEKQFFKPPEISLIHRGKSLLSGHSKRVSQLLTKILIKKGIKLYLNTEVTTIKQDKIIFKDGKKNWC